MSKAPMYVSDINLSNINPREHNDCWVVADSRKWRGCIRNDSLVLGGTLFSEDYAGQLTAGLNKKVYQDTFLMDPSPNTEVSGPYKAYSLYTAKFLGLV